MHRWIVCAVIFAVVISISWDEAAAFVVTGKENADIDPKEPAPLVFVDPAPVKEDPKEKPEAVIAVIAESTAKPVTLEAPQTTEISREEMPEEEDKKKPVDIANFFIITGRH